MEDKILFRVPKGLGDYPCEAKHGALHRLIRCSTPSPISDPIKDYDIIEIKGVIDKKRVRDALDNLHNLGNISTEEKADLFKELELE